MRNPPKPKLPWRQLDTTTASRFKTKRARFRAARDPKYKKMGDYIKRIRKQFGKSQMEFAVMVGVSKSTLKRWELGLGHLPSLAKKKGRNGEDEPSNRERLAKLGRMAEDLRKSGTKFE